MVGRGRQPSLAMAGRALPLRPGSGSGAAPGDRPCSCSEHPTRTGARMPPGGEPAACVHPPSVAGVRVTRHLPASPPPAALRKGYGGVPPQYHPKMGVRGHPLHLSCTPRCEARRRSRSSTAVNAVTPSLGGPPLPTRPTPHRLDAHPHHVPVAAPAAPPPARHPAGTSATRRHAPRRAAVASGCQRGRVAGAPPPRRGARVYAKSTAAAGAEKQGGRSAGRRRRRRRPTAARRRCQGGRVIPPRHPRRATPPRHGRGGLPARRDCLGGPVCRCGGAGVLRSRERCSPGLAEWATQPGNGGCNVGRLTEAGGGNAEGSGGGSGRKTLLIHQMIRSEGARIRPQ